MSSNNHRHHEKDEDGYRSTISSTSSNHLPKKTNSIHLLNEEDLELDDENEIIIPYEILNPNESIVPLTNALEHSHGHRQSPKNENSTRKRSNSVDKFEADFDVLPIESFREEILTTLRENQIMICIGETGSGKTTQIPQFFMKAGLLEEKKMAVTQPRRIAAISVSKRVSEEMDVTLGNEVGYIVRFDDMTNEKTKIKFMTDGILIRECLSDPLLQQYSLIMLDEAHERSLNTDILFGLLKNITYKRKDLKLIITSATLDAEKFSAYFFHCPILHIPGRNYPVDIYHSKTKQIMTINGPANTSYIQTAVDIVLKIHQKEEDGHILVFLTGQEEIEKACLILKQTLQQWKSGENTGDPEEVRRRERLQDRELVILPLYAALSNEEQVKIFQKPQLLLQQHQLEQQRSSKGFRKNQQYGVKEEKSEPPRIIRKCVISTNIAETSITVPHVRFVVDAGYVKQKVFDPSRGMESLVVVPVSKIAAIQRAGRAGRTGPGQCYRLFSSECFDNMLDETVPEVQRTNLANTILYLKAIGIRNIIEFDFLDPPSEDQILQALLQLYTLRAIDPKGDITPLGRKMSNFPLDPCLSRMLIESASKELNCVEDMIIICSMLSVENVFYKPKLRKSQYLKQQQLLPRSNNITLKANKYNPYGPGGNQQQEEEKGPTAEDVERDRVTRQLTVEEERIEIAHSGLKHEYGDFLTLWNIFKMWEKSDFTYEWCERNYINYRSMKTARKIRDHLSEEIGRFRLHEFTTQYLPSSSNTSSSSAKDSKPLSLDKRLCHAITSGYFMNAAMQCSNDSVYKCMSLPVVNKSSGTDIRLVYISPQSAYSNTTPPEYVVYQELVFNNKLYMRNVCYVSKKRLFGFINEFKPVSSLQLNGIDPVPVTKGKDVGSNEMKRKKEGNEDDSNALKKAKFDSTSNSEQQQPQQVQPSPLPSSSSSNARQLEIEQAKLRYLQRKKN